MKILTRPGETPREAYKRNFKEACENVGVSEKDKNSPLNGRVKIRFDELMSENVLGRMTPVRRKSSPTPSREGANLMKVSLFHGCYPRKLRTDRQKYHHLIDLINKGDITEQVFNDLKGALRLKR
jgi:hypothetical protein